MNQLRVIILSVWRNLSEASRAIGCNRQRLSGVVDGRLEMYAWEAVAVADAAGVDVLDVISAAQSVRRKRAGPQKKSPRKCCSTSGSGQ